MNRIEKKFLELRKSGKKAFIAYLTVGYPSVAATERIVLALADSGVDMFELGIPFSDPLADGQLIQEASAHALSKGVTLNTVLSLAQRLRSRTDKPLLLMGYYNQILRFGIEHFADSLGKKGIDGVVVPDLPIEESAELDKQLRKTGAYLINFITPTTDTARARRLAKASKGFIYYVSLTGTTGTRNKLPDKIAERVKLLKKITKVPVCVGFGISNRGQFRKITSFCEGAIIGSAIISKIKENIRRRDLILRVSKFVKNIIS